MADIDLRGVDIDELLKKLTLRARRLYLAWVGLTGDESALPGLGVGPEDLAVGTLVRFLDPDDYTVTWKHSAGTPTTVGVLAYLRRVLNNDFLDLLRSKAHETTVIVEAHPAGADEADEDAGSRRALSLDGFASEIESPDGQAIRRVNRDRLLARFEGEPDLQDILELQLDPDGYCAYTNQDLALLLGTTVSEMENRKKRLDRRLLGIHAEMQSTSSREEPHG